MDKNFTKIIAIKNSVSFLKNPLALITFTFPFRAHAPTVWKAS